MTKQMKELQKKNAKELRTVLTEKREALRAFRFGTKGSRTRDTQQGANLKKDIARILTILNTREDEVTAVS